MRITILIQIMAIVVSIYIFIFIYKANDAATLLMKDDANIITKTNIELPTESSQLFLSSLTLNLNPLKFCRVPNFTLPRIDDLTNKTWTFVMNYQCESPQYKNFTERLQTYAESNPYNSTTWGRRKYPLPPNKDLIALGNSHLRQHLQALICQFAPVIVDARFEGKKTPDIYIRFANNSTIRALINSPVEMAKDWKSLLQERYTSKPLMDFDAFLLGQFNNGGQLKDIQNTTYYRQMMNMSKNDKDLDFEHQAPPNFVEVAKYFSKGPIVFASNYYSHKQSQSTAMDVLQAMSDMAPAQSVERFQGILSRKYIPFLDNDECGTDDFLGVGWCHPKGGVSHRCNGYGGGYPDLIAFDIVESLFKLFEKAESVATDTK